MTDVTLCLWFNGDAEDAAGFYAETFPDSAVGAIHRAPGDYPSGKQGDVLTVEPPPYRFDLQIEEDLIEEVARLIGFDRLPHTPPLAPVTARVRPEAQRGPFAVRRQLAQLGYQETINFSFVEARWEHELAGNADPIKLLNPIASQMSVMRSSLVGSLVAVLKFNLRLRSLLRRHSPRSLRPLWRLHPWWRLRPKSRRAMWSSPQWSAPFTGLPAPAPRPSWKWVAK